MPSKLPRTYIVPHGSGVPEFNSTHLSDRTYEEVVRSLPIICSDVIATHAATRTLWLAWRQFRPARGWWCFGGRMLIGEDALAAAARHFHAASGLVPNTERFSYLGANNLLFQDRQQEPQDVPSHSVTFTFSIDLTDRELADFGRSIGSDEYRLGSLRSFTWPELQSADIAPLFRDAYLAVFGE